MFSLACHTLHVHISQIVDKIVHAAAHQPMAVADPFTGGGAYVPSENTSAPISSSTNPDPFTGGGAYEPIECIADPSRPTVPSPPGLSFTPHQHYQGFETVPDASKVLAKLRDLAPAVEGVNALTPAELAQGGPLEDILVVCSPKLLSSAPFLPVLKF